MSKKIIAVIFVMCLFPFTLFAAGVGEAGNEGWQIPNLVSAVKTANPGDYIVLESGNKFILTREEIEMAKEKSGAGGSDDVPYLAVSRPNASQPAYHLLVLDRVNCRLDSDIGDVKNVKILYKYKHGRNGYLVAIYSSPAEGPVFPQLPSKSRIIVDMVSAHKSPIKDYINSAEFRKYISNRRIITEMQKAL